ncbi:MAG: hypothetical protein U0838_15540, partial [Chloroflexota bacterium]
MQHTTIRLAGRLLIVGVLGLALLTPAAVLAADPGSSVVDPVASQPASEQPTDSASADPSQGTVEVDPTFIAAPTAKPSGAVLAATGKPERTPPPTDTQSQRPAASPSHGLPILLIVLATICLACARMPDV